MKLFSEDNYEFEQLLKLARRDELVIMVGAGCSVESGLPHWNELASRYLNLALLLQEGNFATHSLSGLKELVPQKLLIEHGAHPTRMAIIADAILGENKRHEALKLALYPDRMVPEPGPTAKEVAKLYRARLERGLKTYLITTNFDPLLELALDRHLANGDIPDVASTKNFGLGAFLDLYRKGSIKKPIGLDLQSFFYGEGQGAKKGSHTPHVMHLHGSIECRPGVDWVAPIILTEQDYARYQHLAQTFLSEFLADRDCLMVGMSLRDSNIVSALYPGIEGQQDAGSATASLARSVRTRYLLSLPPTKDGEIDPVIEAQDPDAKRVRQLESQRLQLLGVRPVTHLKTYGQIPQMLHEMSISAKLANEADANLNYFESDLAYEKRLDLWKADFSETYLGESSSRNGSETFAETQVQVSEKIEITLNDIMSTCVGSFVVTDELAIHVWARDNLTDHYRLVHWAGNEYARKKTLPRSLARPVVYSKYDIAIRQAFAGVSSGGFRKAAAMARWAQVMAVPIIPHTTMKDQNKYGRILVGVVTLSTNLDASDSDLSFQLDEDKELLSRIEEKLSELGVSLLVRMNPDK